MNNAVLTVPAIGGSYVAYDILSEQITVQQEELMLFIENALYLEQDFEWLLKTQPLAILNAIVKEMLPYVKQVAGFWESLWDFLPYDCYKTCIDALDADACAGLIAKTTDFHENVMKNMGASLRRARALGVNVSIVAGNGHATVTGSQQNSDAIIGTAAATGVMAAPYGQRFSNGYVCTGNICTNPAHDHLSPSMEIDASYGYLPENTWFVDGMFHGMTMNESRIEDLVIRLLLTDDLKDVHTDAAFPQFLTSENMAYAVYGSFNGAPDGYITSGADTYTVTNLSEEYDLQVLSIYADGLDISFDGDYRTAIAPVESAMFTVNGNIPALSAARAAVTVTFRLKGSVTPLNFRTFRYTVKNGDPVPYDADSPFSDLDFAPPVSDYLPGGAAGLLKKAGFLDWFSMWFNILLQFMKNLRSVF